MADQQAHEMLAKISADINGLSLVVGELIAEQCRKGFLRIIPRRKPSVKLESIAANINRFLDDLPFTPDWQREQMKAWTRDRVEIVISRARNSLAGP